MAPTSVQPPDPDAPSFGLEISLASEERLREMLPQALGRYELLELIGEGGMARVFRATLNGPAGFKKTVAIKLLKATVQHHGAGQDFMQEAVYASRLHHPNVVDVYELGEEQGCPFIAMEWVDGEPLQKLLEPNAMPPPSVVLDLLIALLNGLEHAHTGDPASNRSGMLHRDIKPSNIIVSRHGVPKLVDFGIAAQLDDHAGIHWPEGGMVLGTINWMSPEQLQAQPLDERSDLFSFGLVMAAVVLCRSPLRKKYLYDLLKRGDPIPDCLISIEDETLLDKHIPGLGSVVARVLSRDRKDRPRNSRELRGLLQGLRAGVGHRPSLPQWMMGVGSVEETTEADVMNETTWVMDDAAGIDNADTKPVPAANIPDDQSVFVGRSSEFASLLERVNAGTRLISLVGTGGAGKTRLSRRVVNHFAQQLAGGAWFVDLSHAEDEDGIVRAVAKALKIHLPVEDTHTPIQQLGRSLAGRERMLMVLDNFEQLVEHGAATVSQWIATAPNVQFLVTTREALAVEGEVRVALNPLTQDEAVELLKLRAQLAGADWTDTEQASPVLRSIVDALDRLPLAIELAAARARMLTPEALRDRLDERFKLLRGSNRDQTDRQATLFNLIDWSWQRLEPWERAALAQMSCFRGGFSMDSAEAIIDVSAWPQAPWTLDVIGALIDKSLVHTQIIDDQPRMFMYVSIRDFAVRRLSEQNLPTTGPDIAAATRARHAAYFAAFAPIEASGNARLIDPMARRELHTNFENLLSAAQHGPQPHRTLCAMGALDVLMTRGPMGQALTLIESLLGAADIPDLLMLRLWVMQARTLRTMGRFKDAIEAMNRAAEAAREADVNASNETLLELNEVAAGMPSDVKTTLTFEIDRRLEESRLLRVEGHYVDSQRVLEEALTLCSPTRTPTLQAKVQHALGWLLWTMGKANESISHLRESRAAYRVANQPKEEAMALSALGYVIYQRGDAATAHAMYIECLTLLAESGDDTASRMVLGKLGNLERDMGQLETSLRRFDEAVALQQSVGDYINEMVNRIDRTRTLIALGQLEYAETEAHEIIAASRKREVVLLEALAQEVIATIRSKQDRHDEAIAAQRFAYDTFRGKIPLTEATLGIDLAIYLARAGQLDELDDLTLGQEQHVESMPLVQIDYIRKLAEVRLSQNEAAAAFRHIERARDLAKTIDPAVTREIVDTLQQLETRLLGGTPAVPRPRRPTTT